MAQPSNEDIVREYTQAATKRDVERLAALRHPDWYSDWPQSGERVRGDMNFRAIAEAFPGGQPDVRAGRVVGSEDRWVVTPMYTVQRIVGSGDSWWADGTITYSNGATWFYAMILELRDGKIYRETEYFAEPFEAPEWRRPYVERMDGESSR